MEIKYNFFHTKSENITYRPMSDISISKIKINGGFYDNYRCM
jgi:hypothetical protein